MTMKDALISHIQSKYNIPIAMFHSDSVGSAAIEAMC